MVRAHAADFSCRMHDKLPKEKAKFECCSASGETGLDAINELLQILEQEIQNLSDDSSSSSDSSSDSSDSSGDELELVVFVGEASGSDAANIEEITESNNDTEEQGCEQGCESEQATERKEREKRKQREEESPSSSSSSSSSSCSSCCTVSECAKSASSGESTETTTSTPTLPNFQLQCKEFFTSDSDGDPEDNCPPGAVGGQAMQPFNDTTLDYDTLFYASPDPDSKRWTCAVCDCPVTAIELTDYGPVSNLEKIGICYQCFTGTPMSEIWEA